MVAYGALEMGVSDNRGALNRVPPIVGNSQMYTDFGAEVLRLTFGLRGSARF